MTGLGTPQRKASWANYGNCVDWFAPGVAPRPSAAQRKSSVRSTPSPVNPRSEFGTLPVFKTGRAEQPSAWMVEGVVSPVSPDRAERATLLRLVGHTYGPAPRSISGWSSGDRREDAGRYAWKSGVQTDTTRKGKAHERDG